MKSPGKVMVLVLCTLLVPLSSSLPPLARADTGLNPVPTENMGLGLLAELSTRHPDSIMTVLVALKHEASGFIYLADVERTRQVPPEIAARLSEEHLQAIRASFENTPGDSRGIDGAVMAEADVALRRAIAAHNGVPATRAADAFAARLSATLPDARITSPYNEVPPLMGVLAVDVRVADVMTLARFPEVVRIDREEQITVPGVIPKAW